MSRSRTAAATAGLALAAATLVTGGSATAAGEATPPPVQDITTFCAGAGDSGFTDTDGNTFEAAIDCIAATDPPITQGGPGALPASQYGPSLSVTRGQMASFIARMIDAADGLDTGDNIRALPAYDGTPAFTDIGTGQSAQNPHFTSINRLEQAGIVEGGPGARPDNEYGPNDRVTRAQMASFINRAFGYMTGAALESSEDYFTDDEGAVAHEANINAITSVGIVQGTDAAGDTYAPGRTVSRAQMAGFIARTLGELEERGDIAPLGEAAPGEGGGDGGGGGGGGGTPPAPLTGLFVDDDAVFDGEEDGTSERPFDTIQEAVDAAESGENVIVRDGVYTEMVTISEDDDLTIIAVDEGADNDTRPRVVGTFAIDGVAGTTISGFEVDPELYGPAGGVVAFYLQDVSGVTIEHNLVTGDSEAEARQGTGVLNAIGGPLEEATILGNEFINLLRGTFANPSADYLIDDNVFSDSVVGAANDATSEITGNTFTGNDEAIGLATDAGALVTGNEFADNLVHVRDYDPALVNDEDVIHAANTFDRAAISDSGIFSTIQDAVDTASTGDTVTVYAVNETDGSTYEEVVTITTDDLTLQGDGQPELQGSFVIDADGVTVQGFEITDFGDVPDEARPVGIYIIGGSTGFQVLDNTLTTDAGESTVGITTDTNVNDGTIDGNTITGGDLGIYLQGPGDYVVSNNTLTGIGNDNPANAALGSDVTGTVDLTGNTFTDNTTTAVELFTPGATLTGNTFSTSAETEQELVADPNANYEEADEPSLEDFLASNAFPEDAVIRPATDSGARAIVTNPAEPE